MEKNIYLSVISLTYNHEKYISKAIDGILMQETSFNYEAIVADDASTDSNQAIIKKYQKMAPDIIKPILRVQNIGAFNNFDDALSKCKGKYIAFCEGDDYWTDPLKLQKQVAFLEENTNYSACAHRTKTIFCDGSERPPRDYVKIKKQKINKGELSSRGDFQLNSLVLRREVYETITQPQMALSGDHALFLMILMTGNFYILDDIMSVYRLQNTGISYKVPLNKVTKDYQVLTKWLHENGVSRRKIQWQKRLYFERMLTYPSDINYKQIIYYYFQATFYSLFVFPFDIKKLYTLTFRGLKIAIQKRRRMNKIIK